MGSDGLLKYPKSSSENREEEREWKQETDVSPKAKVKEETYTVVRVEAGYLLRGKVSAPQCSTKAQGPRSYLSTTGKNHCPDGLLRCGVIQLWSCS